MLWNLLLTGFRKIVKLLYSSLDEYEGGGGGGPEREFWSFELIDA